MKMQGKQKNTNQNTSLATTHLLPPPTLPLDRKHLFSHAEKKLPDRVEPFDRKV